MGVDPVTLGMGASVGGSALGSLTGGKGSRGDPLGREKTATQRSALNFLRGDIEGAQPLATAGTQSFLGLLGGGTQLLGDSPFRDLVETGAPTNLDPFFQATSDLAFRNIDRGAQQVEESFGPQGLRFSTDRARGVDRFTNDAVQQLNQFLLGTQAQASEAARGRQLQAGGLVGQLAGAGRTSALAPSLGVLGAPHAAISPTLPGAFSQLSTSMLPALLSSFTDRVGGKAGPSPTSSTPVPAPGHPDFIGPIQPSGGAAGGGGRIK